jgi:NitT/TauT family transport system permease protein
MDFTVPLATLATIGRIFALIGLSIIAGWLLAYGAVRSRGFENIYVPLVNVLESIPVIGFLPLVLTAFVLTIPGSLGVELAVDFLVFDAVAWNIWIGAYQAFKTVPEPLIEVSQNYRFSAFKKLRVLFIPHSIPRLVSNIFSSFADAFFYISVSEVFTAGVATAKLCPKGACSTFGIGTEITNFLAAGNYLGVYYCLISIGVAVVSVTLLLSRASRWAVAKYGVDTSGVIKRYAGKWRGRMSYPWRALKGETRTISRFASRIRPGGRRDEDGMSDHKTRAKILKSLVFVLGATLLSLFLYAVFRLIASVSVSTWSSYFRETPQLLVYVADDYLRVSIIALASMGLAATAGYYLATHHKLGDAILPAIQAFAAFPAPAYFPVLFIFTIPFVENAFPFFWTEIYIFVLGFLSCFYYVFFDFWVGVQAIPSEFNELVRNHQIGFFTKMRRVILPATLPYLITGLSSTINSAWAGIAIGEFWPNISKNGPPLLAKNGMMYYISSNMAAGQIGPAAYVSLLFAVVVAIYGILFTRNLMDLARRKYVVEEGIFAA